MAVTLPPVTSACGVHPGRRGGASGADPRHPSVPASPPDGPSPRLRLSSSFTTLPVALRGRASTKYHRRGTFERARCSRVWSRSPAVGFAARTQDDAGDDVLTQHRIVDAEHGHLVDGGVECHRMLDVGRVDVVAASDDDVLASPDDVEVAVLVDPAEVAGQEPPVDPGAGRRLGVAVVLALGRPGIRMRTSPTPPAGTGVPFSPTQTISAGGSGLPTDPGRRTASPGGIMQ